MQPRIFRKESLHIVGITDDGAKAGEVWANFDTQWDANPFAKAEEAGYEIRFWGGTKPAPQGKDVHVGFAVEEGTKVEHFTIIALPKTLYAAFEVHVADGYDSGNAVMDRWLEENASTYQLREIDGARFVVEYYDERFKDGNQPDSIVEIWLPLEEV